MGMQINAVSDFDTNEWDSVEGLDGLGQVWPEYDGMYGLDMTWPDYDGMYGLEGCGSCGLGAPPAAVVSKPKGGIPWGTVLIGVGGLGVGVLAAVLVKKFLLKK